MGALSCKHKKSSATNAKLEAVKNWNKQGNIKYNNFQHDEAIKCYNETLKIDPKNIEAWTSKAKIFIDLKQYDKTIQCYDEILRDNTNDYNIWYQKGYILECYLGNKQEALTSYSRAIEINPEFIDALSHKGKLLHSLSNSEEVIESFQSPIIQSPHNEPQFLFTEPQRFRNIFNFNRENIEKLKHYDELLNTNSNDAKIWYEKAEVCWEVRRYDKFIECSTKAMVLATDSSLVSAMEISAMKIGMLQHLQEIARCSQLYNQGLDFYNLEQIEVAIGYFEQMLDIDPKAIAAWHNIGLASVKSNQIEIAIECFSKVLSIDPEYIEAWHNIGLAFYKLKELEKAIYCYNEALKINPMYLGSWNNLGLVYIDLGQQEQAFECFEKVLSIDPSYEDALSNRGFALYTFKQYEKAVELFDQVLINNPQHNKVLILRALTLQALGKHQEAFVDLNKITDVGLQGLAKVLKLNIEKEEEVEHNIKTLDQSNKSVIEFLEKYEKHKQEEKQTYAKIGEVLQNGNYTNVMQHIQLLTEELIEMKHKIELLQPKINLSNINIYLVNKITYDNEILNHPGLLKTCLNNGLDINKILDLGIHLSSDLINAAVEYNDYELILAGLESMNNDGI